MPTSAPSDAEILAAAERVKTAKEANGKKIAELEDFIRKAKVKRAKFTDPTTDEMELAARAWMQEKQPNNWAAMMTDPETFQKELGDFKVSLLSPEEKAFAARWKDAEAAIATANKAQSDLKAEIIAKYPDFFGTTKVASAKTKTASTKDGDKEVKPFTGVLNSKEVDTQKVKDLVAAGTTSETDIIVAIYGDNFTINGSSPRFQIHSIREKLGLIVKKG